MTPQTGSILVIGAIRMSFALAPFLPVARRDLDDTSLSKEILEEADEVLSARASRILLVGFLISSGALFLSQASLLCHGQLSVAHVGYWSFILVLVGGFYFGIPTFLLRHPLAAVCIAITTSLGDLAIGLYADLLISSTCNQ